MARKAMVSAQDRPVTDHPVAACIGVSSTDSANSAPMVTHPMRPPAATTTQRYGLSAICDHPYMTGQPLCRGNLVAAMKH